MIETPCRIALVQMTSGVDLAANTATLCDAVAQAAAGGAAMLFAPEMALLLDRDRTRATASLAGHALDGAVMAVQTAARQAGIWVHIGSAPYAGNAADPRWRNRTLVIDDQGAIRATYDKIHLFDVALATGESWRESAGYAPGDAVVAVDTPLGRLGLTICYDLRFAALFDALGAANCRAIAVPAAFTGPTGAAHWHVLLRARAIEQGCFIIAAAQSGRHDDGRVTYGHALVVAPWGEVILDMGEAPGIGFADLDLSAVDRAHAQLPAIQHRRPLPPPTLR